MFNNPCAQLSDHIKRKAAILSMTSPSMGDGSQILIQAEQMGLVNTNLVLNNDTFRKVLCYNITHK